MKVTLEEIKDLINRLENDQRNLSDIIVNVSLTLKESTTNKDVFKKYFIDELEIIDENCHRDELTLLGEVNYNKPDDSWEDFNPNNDDLVSKKTILEEINQAIEKYEEKDLIIDVLFWSKIKKQIEDNLI